MTDDSPGPDRDRHLAAVLVCGGACCAQGGQGGRGGQGGQGGQAGGHEVLEALKPLVRRTPHAVLIRTVCLHPHGECPSEHGDCAVGLQLCDRRLRPIAPCEPLTGTARTTYRRVESWFDETT